MQVCVSLSRNAAQRFCFFILANIQEQNILERLVI